MARQFNRNTTGLIHLPKLTWDYVRTIRSSYRYSSRTCNLRVLAQRYGVSINTIHKVVTNRTWKCPEYADWLEDQPSTEKRQFKAYLRASIKAKSMYDFFLAAKSNPDAMERFFAEYGR
jgi:predicted RNA-binding protein with RPS1 domain